MPKSKDQTPTRKPRADAEANRQRLLAVASKSFADSGPGASLEEVARTAGVGIGTLYRHFPNRDALVEAVYRQAVEQLGAAAEELARTRSPVEALHDWLLLFVEHLATKKLMAGALATLTGGTVELYAASGVTLRSAVDGLAARAANDIHQDIEPLDLLRAIAGVANTSPNSDWQVAARRLVGVLVAGMRREVTDT